MVRGVTMAMVADEPMLLFWRVEDYGRALGASRDTGLPLTCPPAVAEEIIERIERALMEDPEEEEDV